MSPGLDFNFRSNQTANTNDFTQGWPVTSMLTGKPEFSFNSLQTVAPSFEYLFGAGLIQDDIKLTRYRSRTPLTPVILGGQRDFRDPESIQRDFPSQVAIKSEYDSCFSQQSGV